MKNILLRLNMYLNGLKKFCLQTKAKSFTTFLKMNIFSRFRTQSSIISNEGSHICKRLFKVSLEMYGLCRRVDNI